jgi:hypothetical protein
MALRHCTGEDPPDDWGNLGIEVERVHPFAVPQPWPGWDGHAAACPEAVAGRTTFVAIAAVASFGVTMKQHEDFGACRTSNLRIRRTAEVRRSAIRR